MINARACKGLHGASEDPVYLVPGGLVGRWWQSETATKDAHVFCPEIVMTARQERYKSTVLRIDAAV